MSKLSEKIGKIWNQGPYDNLVYRPGGSERGWTLHRYNGDDEFLGENSKIAISRGEELAEIEAEQESFAKGYEGKGQNYDG